MESPERTCDGENETVNDVLYDCSKLQKEKEKRIRDVLKQDNWLVNKSDLVNNVHKTLY